MDQETLVEFDGAVKNAEQSVDSFLHLCEEMKEFLIIENHNEYQAAEKWASDALDAIGKQLGEQKVRDVAIGLLIIELHRAGTFMLRGCVNEAVYERFNAEMA